MAHHPKSRFSLAAVAVLVSALTASSAAAAVFTPARPGALARNTANGTVERGDAWDMQADGPYGYARLVYDPGSPWRGGESHTFGGRFELGDGRGYVNVLRADNFALYGGDGWHFGVDRYHGDRLGHLVVGDYGGRNQQVVGRAFALPTDRWFDLEVSLTLGQRIAVTLDGRTVAAGSIRVPSGYERVTAVRSGVVATGNPGRFEVHVARMTIDE